MTEEIGMIPPQATELEVIVLGALMIDSSIVEDVMSILDADMFYDNKNMIVYEAMTKLRQKNQPIDLMTVTKQVRDAGKLKELGDPTYIADLTDKVASTANVMTHALVVLEKYILRQHIKNCYESIKLAYDPTQDVFDTLNTAQRAIDRLSDKDIKLSSSSKPIGDVVRENIKSRELAQSGETKLGITTGFDSMDRKAYRFTNGELYILAARPGMGKTSMALMNAMAAARDGKPTLFYSLEMTEQQITTRCESIIAGVSYNKIVNNDLTDDERKRLFDAQSILFEMPLYINDTPGLHIDQIKAMSRKSKKVNDIQIIFADYLQLMNGPYSNDQNHKYEYISQELKNLSKELDLPVVALSQLSRNVEGRKDKRPLLSDLRNSGGIEQAADCITFIYRPYYYYESAGDENFRYDENGIEQKHYCEILNLKNRNGQTGVIADIKWDGQCTRFYEDSEFDTYQTPF